MQTTDMEFLRECFKDLRTHVGLGTITDMSLSTDFSKLLVKVLLQPEGREIVATMSFPDCGADSGIVCFPELDDLVLVNMVDGDQDLAYVTARFSSIAEPIPLFARQGDTVVYSRPGKKMYVGSDTKVGIGRPNIEPTEPLVLGNVTINGLTALVNAFLNASQIGQDLFGPVFLDPALRTALTQFKTTYLTDASTNIVSQVAFTERGTD